MTRQMSGKTPGPARNPKRGRPSFDVVKYCVYGPAFSKSARELTTPELIFTLHEGLPVRELLDLQISLDVPMEKLVPMLGISKATLHRRKISGKLDAAESDRVVRYARLLGRAVTVLSSEESARQWLQAPQIALEGRQAVADLADLPPDQEGQNEEEARAQCSHGGHPFPRRYLQSQSKTCAAHHKRGSHRNGKDFPPVGDFLRKTRSTSEEKPGRELRRDRPVASVPRQAAKRAARRNSARPVRPGASPRSRGP